MSLSKKTSLTIAIACAATCLYACSNNAKTAVSHEQAPGVSATSSKSAKGTTSNTTDIFTATKESDSSQDSNIAKKDYSKGDYVHSPLVVADENDFEPAQQIRNILKRQMPTMDLHTLRFLCDKLTGKDLEPLKSPAARVVRNLNLQDLPYSDQDYDAIKDLKLTKLSLYKTPVHNLNFLKGMDSLKDLDIQHDMIDEAGMKSVSSLHNLENLDISNTPITDAQLHYLYGLHKLKTLRVAVCHNLTDQGLKTLKAKLPACQISTNWRSLLPVPKEAVNQMFHP